MSGPYQGRDLSNCGIGRLRIAINCGDLSVKESQWVLNYPPQTQNSNWTHLQIKAEPHSPPQVNGPEMSQRTGQSLQQTRRQEDLSQILLQANL